MAGASAAVPPALLAATARAALPFAAGQTLTGLGPANAGMLAEALLRSAGLRKFTFCLMAALSLLLFGSVATMLGWHATADGPPTSAPSSGPDDTRTSAVDRFGAPLPPGALARLGTVRWRHGARAWFAAFLPDGKQLLSVGADGIARLWNLATGQEVR